MDACGLGVATPSPPAGERPRAPFIDLSSGYVRRAPEVFPQQGSRDPWRVHQSYLRDRWLIGRGDVRRGMRFTPARQSAAA